jgi:hypothetical protein
MVDWWKRWIQFNVTAKLTMIASVAMSWRCAEWFMNLEDPTTQQSAFVSVIMHGCYDRCVWYLSGQRSKRQVDEVYPHTFN